MAASDPYKLAMCAASVARGRLVSLHGADPGTTGANELAGGGYARKLGVWGAPAMQGDGTAKATMGTQQFDVEANDSASHYGVWNDAGTEFQYSRALVPGVTINAAGNGKVDVTISYTYAQT